MGANHFGASLQSCTTTLHFIWSDIADASLTLGVNGPLGIVYIGTKTVLDDANIENLLVTRNTACNKQTVQFNLVHYKILISTLQKLWQLIHVNMATATMVSILATVA